MATPLILVVDDDAPTLVLMRNLLRQFGFEPVATSNGPEAIEQARQRTPDLILLDWNMPGMSGDEVLRTMRAESALAAVPVLILSGAPMEPEELSEIGATGAIMKPFDVMNLVETIRKFC